MADEAANPETPVEDVPTGETEAPEAPEAEAAPEGADALGDAGKQALDRMKQERNQFKAQARESAKALADIKAEVELLKNGGKEDSAAKAIREAEAAANSKANERILKAELKAAAAGKLADPADVYKFIDLSEFEVGSDGDVDADAIGEAIEDLLKSKPYLGAATAKRFQGSADGGARKEPAKPSQLSREDLKGMSPEAINSARAAGRLNDLLGIKA